MINKIKYYLKKKIIKWLYNTKALEITYHKSYIHMATYSDIYLFGEKIGEINWRDIEMLHLRGIEC